ncbi:MAG: glycosyltransferase [Candidatus Kryptonium sp.]|nr:glycosyltransferase [Candidatus Kryptonium sp.]
MRKKEILIIFLGNPSHDSRSFKMFKSLSEAGHIVKIICAHQPGEAKIKNPHIFYVDLKNHKRAVLKILSFYIKAFPVAIKFKADVVIASDLFSLPLAWITSRKCRARLIYDSRELYSSLASHYKKPIKQLIVSFIERFFALRSSVFLTVNQSIAKILSSKFNIENVIVIRNFPSRESKTRFLEIPHNLVKDSSILLTYFGLFHPGRALTIYFDLLEKLRSESYAARLLLIGRGELKEEIEKLIKQRGIAEHVSILGPYSPEQYIVMPNLKRIIGLCIIEPLGASYIYSLPNKIFEYIQHQIPFVASDFPEIKSIVEKYQVGLLVNPRDFDDIFLKVKKLIENESLYEKMKENCKIALDELTWENEIKKLLEVVMKL